MGVEAVLRHAELGEVQLSAGSQVWVDGDLVEVYPAADGVTSTWRSEIAWTLEMARGGGASWQAVDQDG